MAGLPHNRRKIKAFKDTCVIYYSRTDKCWVAHSLRMDQIGAGDCVVEALAELIKAVDHVLHCAQRDATLGVLREAPAWVRAKVTNAQKLPAEVYEIAYKMVRGQWPEKFEPEFKYPKNRRFVSEITEELMV